jgi:hypothetical protein
VLQDCEQQSLLARKGGFNSTLQDPSKRKDVNSNSKMLDQDIRLDLISKVSSFQVISLLANERNQFGRKRQEKMLGIPDKSDLYFNGATLEGSYGYKNPHC